MKKFKAAAIMLSMLLVGAVGCTPVPDTPDPGSEEGWQGNWTRPDFSEEDDPPVVHYCSSACYVCGKCLSDCEDEVCADKCYEIGDRTKYVFNGVDSNVIKNGGVSIAGDYLGNINQNASAEIIYYIKAEEETTVCLGATVTEQPWDIYVTSATAVTVNGEPFYSRGHLAAGPSAWANFYTVWLGCVKLEKGENEIVLKNEGGNAFNFKDLTFLSDTELTLIERGGAHQCGHLNEAGKCTDYTCNEQACMDKDETGWQTVQIGGGDDRVLKYATQNGREISIWIEREQCIGQIAQGSISNQTVAFSFEASEETYVRITLNTSTAMTMGMRLNDLWTFTFNGAEVTTGAVHKSVNDSGWFTYVDNTVIYLKATAGRNDFVMVHKNTDSGDNIKDITIGYEKGTVSFVQAPKPGADTSVNGVTLTAADGQTSVAVNDTLQLTATVSPSYADNKNVTFSSSDDNIATVDENGLVTARGAGEAIITVTTEDGNYQATIALTVIIPVQSVTLAAEGDVSELTETETLQLTATVLPENASNKKVTYSTSDRTVATVDENGLVTAISAGTVVITVTTEQGGKTATLNLTVNEKNDRIEVTGVTLATEGNVTGLKKGETLQLIATVAPTDATNKNVTYESGDRNIATVNENGEVTAVGGGTVTVTVTAEGGHTASITLTVTVDAESVAVTSDSSDGTMFAGNTLPLRA